MMSFLRNRTVLMVTGLLLAESMLFYAYPKTEIVPLSRPLREIPTDIEGWRMIEQSEVDPEVQALLKADDTVNRLYVNPAVSKGAVSFYAAFFKTQRTGVAPHSPKVCLPGAGWVPSQSTYETIDIPGRGPITVNHYVVARGDQKSVVLYWYQNHKRVVANEYAAKVWTVLDALRYRRSDTSMVRVIVPVANGNEKEADQVAINFVQQILPTASNFLPR